MSVYLLVFFTFLAGLVISLAVLRTTIIPRRPAAETCLYFHLSNSPGHKCVVDVGTANHRIDGPSREQST